MEGRQVSNKITIADLRKLQAGQKGSKKPKKPAIDYKEICALPCWKVTNSIVNGEPVSSYTLPMPPSANKYWRNVVIGGKARTLVSEGAKNYKKEIAELAHRLGMRPAVGDVSIAIRLYRNQASGDLDNRIKVTLDALRGVAFEDDKQVVEIHAYRHDDKGNGRIVISVLPV